MSHTSSLRQCKSCPKSVDLTRRILFTPRLLFECVVPLATHCLLVEGMEMDTPTKNVPVRRIAWQRAR